LLERPVLVELKGGCGGGGAAHADGGGPAAGEAGVRVSPELAEVLQRGRRWWWVERLLWAAPPTAGGSHHFRYFLSRACDYLFNFE
jgi:hypothetical protein